MERGIQHNPKKDAVAILMSEKSTFQNKNITGDKDIFHND